MPKFIATTSRGLENALFEELSSMGIKGLEKAPSGVEFQGNWSTCYKVNLQSRIASRVLLTILDFTAYKPEELYHNIQKHDFTKYIDPQQTLTIEASVRESAFKDQRFLAMKIKDAIVDQFREKFDERPSVDNKKADLRIYVRGVRNTFNVSVDTSGESLFKRGYREEALEAPLKENVAAGLLALSDWDCEMPLVDPFCGSGTFLIEAALKMQNISPGTLRKEFGFEKLKGFQEEVFEEELQMALDQEKEETAFDVDEETLPKKLYGYDIDSDAIKIAKRNAKKAGVSHLIEFKRHPVETLVAPAPEGMIIANPPYGARIGEEVLLTDLYKDFAHTMKANFKGWTAYVLSGNPDLSKN